MNNLREKMRRRDSAIIPVPNSVILGMLVSSLIYKKMEGKFNKSLMTYGGAERFTSRSGSSLDGRDEEEFSI